MRSPSHALPQKTPLSPSGVFAVNLAQGEPASLCAISYYSVKPMTGAFRLRSGGFYQNQVKIESDAVSLPVVALGDARFHKANGDHLHELESAGHRIEMGHAH
jgi:hypothetical protein